MKEIKLTKGQFALVDDDDYDYLMQWKWHAVKLRGKFYARRGVRVPNENKIIKFHMHREIMKPPCDMFIDHIDGNGLNNKKSNLRMCTCAQNSINKRTPNKNGFRGVSKNYHHYSASIRVNRMRIYLGTYKTAIEAAVAYDRAAVKYHKKFAMLNFEPAKD